MSHALIMECSDLHTDSFLINMGVMYMMQNFDVLLRRDEWKVQEVPEDTDNLSIF